MPVSTPSRTCTCAKGASDTALALQSALLQAITGLTQLVSARSDGGQTTNGFSGSSAISADGRAIAPPLHVQITAMGERRALQLDHDPLRQIRH